MQQITSGYVMLGKCADVTYGTAHFHTTTCLHRPTSRSAIPFLPVIIRDCAITASIHCLS